MTIWSINNLVRRIVANQNSDAVVKYKELEI